VGFPIKVTRKTILRALGAGSLILVGGLVLLGWGAWSAAGRLERRLTKLRQEGHPVSILEVARRPIPSGMNAAPIFRELAPEVESVASALESWYPKQGYPTGSLPSLERERLEGLFAGHASIWAVLEEAASRPEYLPRVDVSVSPTLSNSTYLNEVALHRLLNRVLRARTALLVSQGQNDEALKVQVLALKLSRLVQRAPFLMAYLTGVACSSSAIESANQVIRLGSISDETRDALNIELSFHDSHDSFQLGLISERALSLSMLEELLPSGFWSVVGVKPQLALSFLDLYDRHLKNLSQPFYQLAPKGPSVRQASLLMNPFSTLPKLLDPALSAGRSASERLRALSRSLRVLNAIESRDSFDGNQAIPSVEQLGLQGDVGRDPFDGKPLRIQRKTNGWLVYSVGPDRVDDGGLLEKGKDVGVGPADLELEAHATTLSEQATLSARKLR